jgi:hypothetical protein
MYPPEFADAIKKKISELLAHEPSKDNEKSNNAEMHVYTVKYKFLSHHWVFTMKKNIPFSGQLLAELSDGVAYGWGIEAEAKIKEYIDALKKVWLMYMIRGENMENNVKIKSWSRTTLNELFDAQKDIEISGDNCKVIIRNFRR